MEKTNKELIKEQAFVPENNFSTLDFDLEKEYEE